MDLSSVTAYEVISERRVEDLKSDGAILRHKKTGAKVALLSNEDKNKVFYIGFRTPPQNSTGVAHIIEHSVLCGSDKYPVKDPFVELAKGSLNTFLNAMTYPDKTVYPVASCNDKDFHNLMDVYLDAVFHPNIYKEEKIFKQEGWHYECESVDGPITLNGVVYNEMKGAYSSADDLLDRETLNQLYPDTAYGVDSGGKPANIPDLSYEEFIAFHQSFYHPSNSYIYLYGDMDMAERLDYIDREYLSKYDYLAIDSEIKMQKPFDSPKAVTKDYPVLESETDENTSYFSYNVSIKTSLDKELYVALQVLDYALCSVPGSPVKVALFEKGIGEDVYSICENGIYQPYFSIVAKNCKKEDADEFIRTIEETLASLIDKGMDKDALKAAINYYEFKYKEADFGSYPKGLMYGLQALDSWLYDEKEPFMHIEANETFRILRQKAETDYFEQLIKTQILENPHKASVVLNPKAGLEKEEEEALKEKLAAFKSSLSTEEIQQIVDQTKELKEYQSEETSPEDLKCIPMLTRADLTKEAEGYTNEIVPFSDTKILYHPIYTNGVSYIRIVFQIRDIKKEQIPYLALLKNILGLVNTEKYEYGQLFNEMNLRTGGIGFAARTYTNAQKPDEFDMTFEIKAKTLCDHTKDAFELISEMLFTSDLSDKKRLKEILGEMKARMQGQMMSAGHSLSVMRAMSYLYDSAWVEEEMNGISFFRFITDLINNFDEKIDTCIQEMKMLLGWVLNKGRVFYDLTGKEEELEQLKANLPAFETRLDQNDNSSDHRFVADLEKKNEAFCTPAGIQYVCRAGDFADKDLPYVGALRVMKVMMGYDYLWIQVRVKGGAYGCMSNFTKSGSGYFVSYRDPNLEKTIDVYKGAADYIRNWEADEETMTKYVIGAIAEKDMPLGPNAEGSRSYIAYMNHYDFEQEQKERDEILNCSVEDIHRLGDYIEAMMDSEVCVVVGNESSIKENEAIFGSVQPLF